MAKNKIIQTLTIIALQKLKKNFWSVFSFGVIVILLFESLYSPLLQNDFSKSKEKVQNKQIQSFDYLPSSTTNQIIKHDFYTLSYNEKYEQAEWVAYELKKKYVKNNNF